MKVEISNAASKSLLKVPEKFQKSLIGTLEEIKQAKDFSELFCEKLKGASDRFKIRKGNYRIVLKKITNTHVQITAIADGKEIYKRLFEIIL